MKKLIIFLILSLTLAIADQINVSNAGSDTNGDGSSGSPFKTIQYAIEHANTSSGDTILVAVGTYAENINFRGKDIVIGSLTLTTSDKSYVSQTIIDGGSPTNSDSASVVTFLGSETSSAKLIGFTLQNGNGLLMSNIRYGGGIYTKSASPSLKHLIIRDNANSISANNLYGGGIYFGQYSDAFLDSTVIINNGKAFNFGYGGGIYLNGRSDVSLDSILIVNNKAGTGGGISSPAKLGAATHIIKRLDINSNQANNGGGIYIGGTTSGIVKMYNTKIRNNYAAVNGGGLYITRSQNKIELYDVSIKNNTADKYGGGAFIFEAKPIIERSLFESNSSINGGAIFADKPSVELNLINSLLVNNTVTQNGSAIYLNNLSTVKIYHTTISKNTAALNATIYSNTGSKIYFYNSIIWNNGAINQIIFGSAGTTAGRFESKNSIIESLSSIEKSENNDAIDTDNSNFDTEPLFSNVILNDFTLKDNSPAIGYGTNDASYSPASIPVSLDFNSNSRPTGNNPDIGAYENSLISAANTQPLINQSLPNISIDEDSGDRTVSFTGVADGDFHVNQTLTVIATSDNTSLIPNPTVTYTSPDTSGTISFKPVPDMIGTAKLTITVSDNGGSSNGGINTVSTTFKVTVNKIRPDNFIPIKTNIGGIIQGSVTLNGNNASVGDWVAAFDTSSTSVGSTSLVNSFGQIRFGVNESNFVLYGDDPLTTEVDEGMNNGDDFILKLWDASTDQIFVEVDSLGNKVSHSGWAGTNFMPISGYDNPNRLFNFVYNKDPIINECNVKDLDQNQKYEFTLNDFQFLDNDSIPDSNLKLTIDPGSNYTVNENSITPESDYTGLIQVGFKINDDFSSSPVFYANINILPLNVGIATPQTVTADEDLDKTITLAGTDPDGDALTYIITKLPSNGYLFQTSDGITRGDSINSIPTTIISENHQVIYVSAKNGYGDGHGNFEFKVNDGTADSRAAVVTLNVNSQPENNEATSQTVTADQDIDKTITLAGTDIEEDALTYIISILPSNGYLFQTSDGITRGDSIKSIPTTIISENHQVIYVSAKDGYGDGHGNFGFKVTDGTNESEETIVVVNVEKLNQLPIAISQTITANEDLDQIITLMGTDPDGDTLFYKITSLPINGYLFQTSDGISKGDTINVLSTIVTDSSNRVIYISEKDENGINYGNFGFKASDGISDSEEGMIKLNVINVNDKPTSLSKTITADEDIDKTILLEGTDVDGDTLSFSISSLPINGYLFQTSDGITRGDSIKSIPTTIISENHQVIYVSAKDGYGDGHGNFGFKAHDGKEYSEEKIVTVNVLSKADGAEAFSQNIVATEDIDVTITLTGATNISDSLVYKISKLPINGYLFQTSDGISRGDTINVLQTIVTDSSHRVIYISAKDGYGDKHGNFGFKVNDTISESEEGIILINVEPVNDPPNPVTLISPTDSSEITITILNKDTSNVKFDWDFSNDVDNNELTYLFEYELNMISINNEKINYIENRNLNYPGLSIPYFDILEKLDQFLSPGGILTWKVDVTDGIDTVYSTDERVVLIIGKYAALSVDESIIPDEYSLSQNYPNPFNPTTRIQYSLPKTGLVKINIYTLMGQKISTLVNGNMEAGRHNITWNGMDDLGNPVAAGLYLYQLEAKDFVKTRKMVLLK